jgi:DNA polymerase delta subunit 3
VVREDPVLMREEEEESSEDAEVDENIAPKPKPKKRREKKVVPVGRNGLKKKRVVKSRTTTDAKGYMGMVILSVTVYADACSSY